MTKRPSFSQLIEHERTLYSRLGARHRVVTSLATVPGLQLPRAHEGRSAESASRFLDFVPHEDRIAASLHEAGRQPNRLAGGEARHWEDKRKRGRAGSIPATSPPICPRGPGCARLAVVAILDDLGLDGPNSVLDNRPPPQEMAVRLLRRDVAIIHTAPQEPRCEDHPDHPADDCPECAGYEVRRG